MNHRLQGDSVLDRLRSLLAPESRAYLHGVTPVLMTALVTFGVTTDALAAVVVGAVIAFIDLVFALVNSTSSWRSALYGLAAALQPVGVAIGIGTDPQWGAALSIAAALLGSGIAAAKTPSL